jgi:hypothetical protein
MLTENTHSNLYIANTSPLLTSSSEDLKLWSEFYNTVIVTGVSLVDRMELMQMPYNFKLYEPFRIPRDLTNFNLSYADVCDKRAAELLAHSDATGLPLYVLYSGGIDSTAVMTAFLRQRDYTKLRNQLVVCMSIDSITENPVFYNTFIRNKFNIVPSDNFASMFDGKCIIVGGEHNDQLFGSDIVGKALTMFPMSDIAASHSNGLLKKFLVGRGMAEKAADWWTDMLMWHSKQAPCEVKTNYELLWWLNFSFKWQTVWFRILLRVDPRFHKNLNPVWLQKHFHHFFTTEDFQKWSMLNPDKKIKDTWMSYKYTAKDYIYDFNKDQYYRDNKSKRGSLYRLFIHKNTPNAITTDWQYLYKINKEDYYQPNNSFKLNFK